MIKITLPDGQIRSYEQPITGHEIAGQISPNLAKATVAMTVNGKLYDANEKLTEDASIVFLTSKDKLGLDIMRHTTTAQGLARAIKELFPQAKLAIGPTVDYGFYYDIELDTPLSSDDLPQIETIMQRIIAENNLITRELWPAATAREYFAERGEPYKVEIIEDAIVKGQLLPGGCLSIYSDKASKMAKISSIFAADPISPPPVLCPKHSALPILPARIGAGIATIKCSHEYMDYPFLTTKS